MRNVSPGICYQLYRVGSSLWLDNENCILCGARGETPQCVHFVAVLLSEQEPVSFHCQFTFGGTKRARRHKTMKGSMCVEFLCEKKLQHVDYNCGCQFWKNGWENVWWEWILSAIVQMKLLGGHSCVCVQKRKKNNSSTIFLCDVSVISFLSPPPHEAILVVYKICVCTIFLWQQNSWFGSIFIFCMKQFLCYVVKCDWTTLEIRLELIFGEYVVCVTTHWICLELEKLYNCGYDCEFFLCFLNCRHEIEVLQEFNILSIVYCEAFLWNWVMCRKYFFAETLWGNCEFLRVILAKEQNREN